MTLINKITALQTPEDFDYIIQGGAFLGSGGGGPIAAGIQMKEDLLNHSLPIVLIDPNSLLNTPQAYGAVVAFMGSPSAGAEGIDLETPTNAFNALMPLTPQKKFSFVMSIELGAGNSLVPMTVASRLGIPIVDGDGACRAVPKIQMTTYAQSVAATPSALSNGKTEDFPTINNIIELSDIPQDQIADALEAYCLKIMEIPAFGSMGGLATFMMQGNQVSQSVIQGSLSYSYAIGRAISCACQNNVAPENDLKILLKNLNTYFYTFGLATVTNIKKPGNAGDLDVGTITLKDNLDQIMTLSYENETLFAELNGKPWAMAPDLICYLTANGAISNVEIEVGTELILFGIPCHPQMRQSTIVNSFMSELTQLGIYSGPYCPIETLHE